MEEFHGGMGTLGCTYCDPQWFHQAQRTWEVWGAHQMLGHQYADTWYSSLGAAVSGLSRQNSVVIEQLFLFNSVYQGYSGVSCPWHLASSLPMRGGEESGLGRATRVFGGALGVGAATSVVETRLWEISLCMCVSLCLFTQMPSLLFSPA